MAHPRHRTIVTEQSEEILLGHPKEKPVVLIAALGRELGVLQGVRGAWLMRAMRPSLGGPSWMLGVDYPGDWRDVTEAVGRAVAGDILQGYLLDVMAIGRSEFAEGLRDGISVLPPRRGFFRRLFG
ncbi:MAG: hypothetical protein JWR89_3494 [Tardiphaga sp.]|uniref:enhanced serine sensitivity protein SseB C-terminal domain-containing protein n=1 Tax=Tardiphaga sp. TaxID=1926292 RepID=UPI0026180E33|nr:enhanced serine sensitivity protein SseB C-terminal domain-containing protein [Tardiphaga sp.]MDB5503592.1 hypothetical protein [Tardiphaga sp.]